MFDCTGMTCEELAEKLKNAQDAYESLVLGRSVRVVVDQNGERVEFNSANRAGLQLYIDQILQAMRDLGCTCSIRPVQVKAFKFIFYR